MRALLEESHEMLAQPVILGVFEESLAGTRTGKLDLQDITDGRGGAVGHHHDAVGKEEGLIDIVRHHERGFLIFLPKLQKDLLQFIARK